MERTRQQHLGLIKNRRFRRNHPLYQLWRGIVRRCFDPTFPGYQLYGAKGVRMCQRWFQSYSDWAKDMGKRPTGASVGRIKDSGDYCCGSKRCPECRTKKSTRNGFWMSHEEQGLQRRLKNLEAKGVTVEQWAA